MNHRYSAALRTLGTFAISPLSGLSRKSLLGWYLLRQNLSGLYLYNAQTCCGLCLKQRSWERAETDASFLQKVDKTDWDVPAIAQAGQSA